MNHATEGLLQAYLDGEVTEAARHEIAEHLGACSACVAELEALQAAGARLSAVLAVLDRPLAVQPALRALRRQSTVAGRTRRQRSRHGRAGLARAALFIVASAGVLSATVPGSPVRQWLSSAWERVTTFFVGERPPVFVDEPTVAPLDEAGAFVAPYQGHVRVVLADALPEATIRIRLVERTRAGVLAAEPGAHFSSGSGWLEAAALGAREVVVELPRGAATAAVEVNGRVVATKDGDVLVAHVPTVSMTQMELVLHPRF